VIEFDAPEHSAADRDHEAEHAEPSREAEPPHEDPPREEPPAHLEGARRLPNEGEGHATNSSGHSGANHPGDSEAHPVAHGAEGKPIAKPLPVQKGQPLPR